MNTLSNMNGNWSHPDFPLAVLGFAIGGIALLIILAWCIYWKGRGLWRAAKNDSKTWFVALLFIITLGILEILYIYVFSKKKRQ
jgi:H+/Cl- antiporter ClcA